MLFGDIMDYNKYSCPVCSEKFQNDDDIVVCPECGTPHHRHCYELLGHCYNTPKHIEGYSFLQEETPEAPPVTASAKCPRCEKVNEEGSLYCNRCGTPLKADRNSTHVPYSRHDEEQNGNASATQQPPMQTFVIDPLAGVSPDTEVGDDVTAGEAAKFVKNNTPFYTRLFYQIKTLGKSRFSFVGFLFTGGWMLYRKMYKLGTVITVLTAAILLTEVYLSVVYNSFLTGAINEIYDIIYELGLLSSGEVSSALSEYFKGLSTEHFAVLTGYYLLGIGETVLQFVCGFCANRWYYKHCMKKISHIKNTAASKEAANSDLQTKGGVNTAIAISLFVAYMAIQFLPGLLI